MSDISSVNRIATDNIRHELHAADGIGVSPILFDFDALMDTVEPRPDNIVTARRILARCHLFSPQVIMDACDFMTEHGDWVDQKNAREVMAQLQDETREALIDLTLPEREVSLPELADRWVNAVTLPVILLVGVWLSVLIAQMLHDFGAGLMWWGGW